MSQFFDPKKKQRTYSNDNILESLRGIGGSVNKSITHDLVGKMPQDVLSSLFGNPPQSGELRPNQTVDIPEEREHKPTFHHTEYDRPNGLRLEEHDLKQKIESVRQELAQLSVSMKQLNTEIQKTISEVPVQPGIYHLNFYDRLRSILRMLRENIDDSRTWLSMSTNRKKKCGYWNMYKKHGTTFGLSSERNLATQAG